MACYSPSCCGLHRLGFHGLDGGGKRRAVTLPLPLQHLVVRQLQFPRSSSIFTAFARRKKLEQRVEGKEEGGVDEDAFEALFAQLEEDLNNDEISIDENDDDEISEEDLANLEKELEEAFGDVDLDELSSSNIPSSENIDSDDEAEEIRPKLKNWQLRRLASAFKIGRRKTNIKSLSAELGLDRSFVLEMLRNPPSDLLLLSASLPDIVLKQPVQIENKFIEEEEDPSPLIEPIVKPDSEAKTPIRLIQSRWSTEKKLKKMQVQVLEKVYHRTKRPTDAMVSSIVYVTHLPRKRIIKWFEDKRVEDGIPVKRKAFQRM